MAYSFEEIKIKKDSIVDWLLGEFRSVQTGRATPLVLDAVHLEQYGARTPLAHVASISIEDPRTLRVSPWDKSIVREIEKAINEADIGLSVSTDEQGLRVIFPMLTTETRQKLVKILKERLEDARVRVRALREEGNKDIDARAKEGEYGEDDQKRYRDELQKIVDMANAELEEVFEKKEKEVMGE